MFHAPAEELDADHARDRDAQEVKLRDNLNPQTQRDLLDWFRHAPMPMPRTQTELFQLLSMYNPRHGWDAFVETIDFTGVTPRQIYQVVLGRHPETIGQAMPASGYDIRQHFRAALVSKEFRSRFLATFLKVYWSKGRDVFIHVPKCAGTDLILSLGCRSVPLPKLLEIEGWLSDAEFLEITAGLARAAMTSERLFIYGHMDLGGYIDRAGIRPDDRVFTVLREPIDMMVSQANYAVGRVRQDPIGRDPDAAGYLRQLGLTSLPEGISMDDLKDLTLKAMLDPKITEPNRACFYLGRGSKAIFSTALENLIIHDVEITTTKNYDRWLSERWGIASSSHHNRSHPLLPNVEARHLHGEALAAASTEDRKLYDVVSWALQQNGTASITGQQLARLIGPALAEVLSSNKCPPIAAELPPPNTEQKLLMAETPKQVAMYLAPVVHSASEIPTVETVVAVGFGNEADGDRYRLQGWATSENGFTWTQAPQSTIRLPRLTGDGTFVVRLVVSPFTVPERRPSQHVELSIDGLRLGACEVRDIAVLEAEVPQKLLGENNRLTLTLNLPTATRPSEVGDSKDGRQLALAVRGMTILRKHSASS